MSGSERARVLVVLHGYEDPPGRHRLIEPGDPAWDVLEPRGPLELPGGPAWFATDDDGPVEVQLLTSVRQVRAVVGAATAQDTGPRPASSSGALAPAVLGGFSQGGAVALAAVLASGIEPSEAGPPPVSHVFCVNGWLPFAPALAYDPAALVDAGTRVLVVASADDEVVLVQQGRSAARWLERAGVDVTYVERPGDHAVGSDALAAVTSWLG